MNSVQKVRKINVIRGSRIVIRGSRIDNLTADIISEITGTQRDLIEFDTKSLMEF
jgi:tyrosine-protein phosphatase YwqE